MCTLCPNVSDETAWRSARRQRPLPTSFVVIGNAYQARLADRRLRPVSLAWWGHAAFRLDNRPTLAAPVTATGPRGAALFDPHRPAACTPESRALDLEVLGALHGLIALVRDLESDAVWCLPAHRVHLPSGATR